MKEIRAIIIDDMPLAIASLRADLEADHPEVDIVAVAEGVVSGAKAIKQHKPDLLFLDIHMGDGDGFDLLELIEHHKFSVIFTTASKDHAIKAFQFQAVDYLLKPVDPELLSAALKKVSTQRTKEEISNTTEGKARPNMATLALNTQEEIRLVSIKDIIRLEAMGNYTTFYTSDKKKLLVTRTMGEFEKVLDNAFLRVHQSHLVNKHQISAYIKTEGGYLKMKDGSDVPVSVRKKSFVMEQLKNQ